MTEEKALSKISHSRKIGFPRIHIPGGTSKDGSFFVGIIVPYYDPITKKTYILCLPYNPYFHLEGESGHNKKVGESPEDAVLRELMEEAGLHINWEDLEELVKYKVPDNRPNKEGQYHWKYFYLVTKFSGTPFDFEGPNPIDGETAAPMWIPAAMALDVLYYSHKEPLKLAIKKLQAQSVEYAYSLMNII